MSLFVIVGLLVCTEAQGSSAVTVFVQEGGDVCLNVTTVDVPEEVFFVSWNFNKTVAIVTFVPGNKPKVSPLYTGRVEFSEENYSLGLKNLRDTDSGVYAVVVTTTQKVQTADYNVVVQVSPVELTVDSVNSSSDSCNLTVSCTTQDSHISSTFRCDNQTCRQEGGERSEVTTSGASLHVYLFNDSIICNYSNQVSWTKDTEMIDPLCVQHVGAESPSAGVSVYLLRTVLVSVGLVIMVSAVISVHVMEKRSKKQKETQSSLPTNPTYVSHIS